MNVELRHPPTIEEGRALNRRLETIGWALFLIMIGGIGLVPATQVPAGTWLIGAGLIMLGLNGVRYYYQIKVCRTTIVLGVLALLVGLSELAGANVPVFPLLLVLLGAYLLVRAGFRDAPQAR